MRARVAALAIVLATAGAARAQDPIAQVETVVTGFVDAVNKGRMDKAMGYYAPSVTVIDDLPPYRWTGPGAGGAWLSAMGANAQKLAITGIEMRVSQVTRVEVAADHAYAIAPGRLSFTYKDGHAERADGLLSFTLVKTTGGWKIDTQTWAGPAPSR